MGAPVVTLAGANFCSRMSASFLGNLGLNELIAETPEEYVEIATGLANDRDRVLDLRAGMRDRMRAAPCCDPARFTRNLESLYRDIWRDWCARRQ
jgi:predicted O-linked N-acetylglucosamine transferase (SPINDLY family)